MFFKEISYECKNIREKLVNIFTKMISNLMAKLQKPLFKCIEKLLKFKESCNTS